MRVKHKSSRDTFLIFVKSLFRFEKYRSEFKNSELGTGISVLRFFLFYITCWSKQEILRIIVLLYGNPWIYSVAKLWQSIQLLYFHDGRIHHADVSSLPNFHLMWETRVISESINSSLVLAFWSSLLMISSFQIYRN